MLKPSTAWWKQRQSSANKGACRCLVSLSHTPSQLLRHVTHPRRPPQGMATCETRRRPDGEPWLLAHHRDIQHLAAGDSRRRMERPCRPLTRRTNSQVRRDLPCFHRCLSCAMSACTCCRLQRCKAHILSLLMRKHRWMTRLVLAIHQSAETAFFVRAPETKRQQTLSHTVPRANTGGWRNRCT